MTNTVVSAKEAAEILGIAVPTVHTWNLEGKFPHAYKLNPSKANSPLRIPLSDIEKILAARQGTNPNDTV